MVEVEFPAAFEHDAPLPIHLGRLYLGKDGRHHCRLVFLPGGSMALLAPETAINDGAIILSPTPSTELLGFSSER